MSGSVSFSYIPPNLRIPLFWIEVSNANAGVNQAEQRALIIGSTINTVPLTPIRMPSDAEAIANFGQASMIRRMVKAYRENDPFGELWAIGIPDPGAGVAATASLAFTGTSTAAGTLSIYIAGQLIQVAVASGVANTAVATAVAAAINASDDVPVTAAASTGTVTLTSIGETSMSNSIDLRLNYYGAQGSEALPPGISVAVTAASGGSGSPDLTGLAAALGEVDYDFIISGFNDATSLAALQALMSDSAGRWSWLNQNWGHVFTAKVDSANNLVTFGTGRNDQHTLCWGAAGLPTPPWEFAAAMTAAVIPSLKADPARPLQTLPVNSILAPAEASRFKPTDQQTLLNSGVALPAFSRAGNATVLRAVTTYQKNAFGQPDQSYLDVETLFTLMAIMRRLRAIVTQKLARYKLADDGTRIGAGQFVVTPKVVRGLLIAEYAAMENAGLVENADLFAKGLVVVRNAQDPSRLDVLYDPNLISGLRVFAVLNQFRLNSRASTAAF